MAILNTKDDIDSAYKAAQKHFKQYFEPLDEFERLARNKPHPRVLKSKMPNVTDGSLAAIVQAQPRRVIQQLPTGKVISADDDELATLAGFIWENEILPHATTQGDPLQKCWIAATKAKTYGYQPSYQFFKNDAEYYGADFVLPYVKDVFPEPGKLNANDSEYVLMQSWWTKAQLQALIAREKQLKGSAKDREESYSSTWNMTALNELLDELQKKDDASKSASEREKNDNNGYALIVHCFQRGVGESFYSYAPKTEKIVRTWTNPDPRGCIPIKFLYDSIDLSNPLGRGAVELSGGMQNLLDSEVQAYQFSRMMGMAPPLKKWGTSIANASVKWKPFAVWDMGTDKANSDIVPVDLNTTAIQSFPNNYGLMKSQILNLTNNQDSSVSSESGNPTQSKTQAGVNQQQERIAVDDNYFRKQFESWFNDVAEDMINIHFAESSGVREVQLTDEFLKKLTPDAQSQYFELAGNETGAPIAQVLYDQIRMKLRFEVDASTTQVKDDDDQKDRLISLLELAVSNPILAQNVKIPQLVQRIVSKSGVEDPEELMPSEEELQQQQMMQAAQAMQPGMPPGGAPADPGQPPQGPPAAGPPPEDQQLIQEFQNAGFSPDQAQSAVTMMQHGYSHDEIMNTLMGAANG